MKKLGRLSKRSIMEHAIRNNRIDIVNYILQIETFDNKYLLKCLYLSIFYKSYHVAWILLLRSGVSFDCHGVKKLIDPMKNNVPLRQAIRKTEIWLISCFGIPLESWEFISETPKDSVHRTRRKERKEQTENNRKHDI